MEHKGLRYELLQTITPAGWKWVVHLSTIKTQTGFSFSKDLAIHAAKRAIEKALEADEKRKGQPL
jgi:hypothetical protein